MDVLERVIHLDHLLWTLYRMNPCRTLESHFFLKHQWLIRATIKDLGCRYDDDLISDLNLIMLKTIRTHDPNKGISFKQHIRKSLRFTVFRHFQIRRKHYRKAVSIEPSLYCIESNEDVIKVTTDNKNLVLDALAVDTDDEVTLNDMVESLPLDGKVMIYLYCQLGHTRESIASIFGFTKGHSDKRLAGYLERLRFDA